VLFAGSVRAWWCSIGSTSTLENFGRP